MRLMLLYWSITKSNQMINLTQVFVPVIVLDDVTNSPDGCQVLVISLWIDVMQRGGGPGIPVGASEINRNLDMG